MLWTDEETRELITLWPTNSASQIASRLDRPRAAVTGKVNRLRQEGALPADVIKHYVVAPLQARPKRDRTAWATAGLCRDGAVRHIDSSLTTAAATGRSARSTRSPPCSAAAWR